MFLQFFSNDAQLAAVVFWTFGDVSRANWPELALIAVIVAGATIYFVANRWNYNAIDAGDVETRFALRRLLDRDEYRPLAFIVRRRR